MAKDKTEVKEEKVLTAEEPKVVEKPVAKAAKPEVKAEAKAAVEEVAKAVKPSDSVILGRAVMFLAFKVLEPSEFNEFKMRYPELS